MSQRSFVLRLFIFTLTILLSLEEPLLTSLLMDRFSLASLANSLPHTQPLRDSESESWQDSLVDGVIGITTDALSDFVFHPSASSTTGGCRWFGTAPLCLDLCPAEFDFIRESSGRCADDPSKHCIPDPSFGQPCTAIFGFEMKKKFCCKSDPIDCTWSGRWMGANDAYNIYCRYDSSVGRCGQLQCSINHRNHKAANTSLIGGTHCDELSMWGLQGRATCGLIQWFSEENVINTWYKTQ